MIIVVVVVDVDKALRLDRLGLCMATCCAGVVVVGFFSGPACGCSESNWNLTLRDMFGGIFYLFQWSMYVCMYVLERARIIQYEN